MLLRPFRLKIDKKVASADGADVSDLPDEPIVVCARNCKEARGLDQLRERWNNHEAEMRTHRLQDTQTPFDWNNEEYVTCSLCEEILHYCPGKAHIIYPKAQNG